MVENKPPLTLSLIRHVYVFYICAKHMNFTQAGNELLLTQSAISKSIKKLESALGVSLFIRNKNYIRLSLAGQTFFANTQCLCMELSEQISNTSFKSQNDTITFNTIPSCANYWLNEIVTEFSSNNQDIKIKINIYNDSFTTSLLDNHLTICCLKNTDAISSDYNIIKLFDEDLVPICKPSLLQEYPNMTDLILRSDVIIHSSRENFWKNILTEFNIEFDDLNTHFELEHFYMIIQAVMQGNSVGLSPRIYVQHLIEKNELVVPFLPKFTSPYSYYLCTHKSNLHKATHLRFINWYKKTYTPKNQAELIQKMPKQKLAFK